MVTAVALIRVLPDQEKAVYRALKEVNGVRKLYHLFGDHDFFLILEAENMNELARRLNAVEETASVVDSRVMLVEPAGRGLPSAWPDVYARGPDLWASGYS